MNISRIFILRPVATSLFMVAVLLSGALGYYLMPLSALPQVDYPSIQVVTLYPGAGPDVMTATVTAPLERQFGQLPGLKQMSSASSPGASVITLQFDLSLALDIAEQQVQAAINAAGNFLPQDLPSPPIYSKVNPADAPIITLAATSNTLSLPQVQDLIETRVAQKISQLNGVGLVTISGGQRPAIRVQVNSGALAINGLSLENVRSAIASANVNSATGSFNGPSQLFTIDINDQLNTAADYRALVLRWQNGAPLRLGDVAKVVDAAENSNLAAWKNTQAALIVNIQRQPGTNVIAVANQIKALLPALRETLPGNLELTPLTDRTITIRASVRDVWIDLLLAVVLVVGTIYIFLRSARATLIPALALPLSIVGTFGVMYLLGFSVNNLTLMALTIAAGFVVDDAIVMIENIARHVEEGKDAKTAALDGARQIAFTIISLTLSLIAVLIPLLFMGDVIGRLFKEFAITLAVAILISAVISLTFTPMLCARMLRPPEDDGALMKKIGQWINRSTELYGRALTVALKHQQTTLWVAFGTLALTILMYVFIPKGLFPVQDTGLLLGISEAPQNVSFSSMADHQQALAKQILRDPAVDSLSSFIGVDGTNDTPNAGRFYINLKPHDQRDKLNVVLARLKESTNNQPGATLFLQPVQDLTLEDRITRTQYQFSLEDSNPDELSAWVPKLLAHLEELPQLHGVTSDMYEKGLQAYVEVDRQSAARVGLTMADVDAALYNTFGQRPVSTIFTQANQYRVILEEIGRPMTSALEAVGAVRISNANGVSIPLSSIARIYEKPASLVMRRQGQLPSANISFNLAPGISLGEAIKAVEKTQEDVALPQSIRTSFQGATLSFRAALTNQIWLLLAALITMYIVLGVLYESYIHPLTILSTLPSAGVGALLALWIADAPLDMFAVLGLILLIGIVKKNAIMMIDFAVEAERNEHLPPSQAIVQACLLRFRPIMMTTFAALFGALPLMISSGVGAELRHPLGIALVGGLILSQLITLFTTPVIYLAFHRLADTWGQRSQKSQVA